MTRRPPPVFLNLTQIRLPVGALTSIGHRISGMVLAASAPIGVYLLGRSLHDEQGFAEVAGLLGHWEVKLAMVLVVWALAHHLLAVVRHLLSDFNVVHPCAWRVAVPGSSI